MEKNDDTESSILEKEKSPSPSSSSSERMLHGLQCTSQSESGSERDITLETSKSNWEDNDPVMVWNISVATEGNAFAVEVED